MECLDFCLFGVYGADSFDRILVESQDNCKKGCPACSRVCPEQAIMFPDYKSPAIAGAAVGSPASLKIDLTKLFGGDAKDAISQAVAERDRELVADGRGAVGMAVGIPKRQTEQIRGTKRRIGQIDGRSGFVGAVRCSNESPPKREFRAVLSAETAIVFIYVPWSGGARQSQRTGREDWISKFPPQTPRFFGWMADQEFFS